MLARDSFRTETPNVIDPGEGPPPTAPSRKSNHNDHGGEPQVGPQDGLETSSDKAEDRRRGLLSSSRYGNSGGGIKQSLYTRDGNKGALPKGIPLRFVLGLEDDGDDDDDVDNDNDDDTCDGSQDVIVFERSSKAYTQETPFHDEDTPLQTKTKTKTNKKNLQISKNNPFFRSHENEDSTDDDDEEENGIAQARLFAAAILNESEKRQHSKRDLMSGGGTEPHTSSTLRQMMHRASSFRQTNSSSLRTIHRGSSHRHLPIDNMNNNSNSNMSNNIWLVDEDIPDNGVSKTGPGSSKTNLLWKKLIRASLAVLLGVLLITIFAVAASQSQSSREGDTNLSTAVAISSDPRLDQIVTFLGEATGISSIETLYDSSSPQFKAAKWLAEEDSEKLDIPATTNVAVASSPFNFVQRYVLLVLFFALGGDTADHHSSWIQDYHFASQDRHECSWYERILRSDLSELHRMDTDRCDHETGVDANANVTSGTNHQETSTQDAHYVAMGVTCDRELRVKGISLPSNNLRGSIPSELQYLSTLDSLDLRNNSLVGSIPQDLQHLMHLTRLDLSSNRLTGEMGPVYDWIGKPLAQLQVLNLSNNRLDLSSRNDNHSRRHSIGGETRLRTLTLGGNIPVGDDSDAPHGNDEDENETTTISVVVPDEIRYLTNLRTLSLDNSQIGGRVPAWLFHELYKLEFLDLSHNRLTGSISGVFPSFNSGSSLQQLHLKSLLLHDNPLTGTLPESIGMMADLTTITIHHTNMTVGTNAANIICWQEETESSSPALESLTTDCGDATCPCCIENCCDNKDCYSDVDWQSGFSAHCQSNDSEDED